MTDVPDIGDILTLMYATDSVWQRLHATFTYWHDPPVAMAALDSVADERDKRVHGVGGGLLATAPTGPSEPFTQVTEVWVDKRGRSRSDVLEPAEHAGITTIVNGDKWVVRRNQQTVMSYRTHPGSVSGYATDPFARPSLFIPHLHFDRLSSTEVDGRPCWLLSGRVPEGRSQRSARHLIGTGDVVQLSIDQNWGFALRIETTWLGSPSTQHEASGVTVDGEMESELFDVD